MAKTFRCAIYTRKSSDEGLDQGFNSLHAQREACEAYVLSQAGEGWLALPGLYDDGGFSGGSLERPGLKALMADVDAGKIDIIVVYKVDRLTRALADFAKIIDRLDAKAASFVSVTQAFNTTSSMGRLTLNVLLSFAQFEREVTGERIRDKIAASKAKGMWMGGNLPLGYETPLDNQDRTLVIHSEEARLVRHIFERYLALGSVHVLERELAADGYRSKLQIAKNGNRRGDAVLSRGALFHLLKNPVYRGKITHKGQIYPGRHPAIIDEALFEAVQKQITGNAVSHRTRPVRQGAAPLRGLIFDASGGPMSPSFGYGRRGKAYRYYVSSALMAGRTPPTDHISRVPAEALEDLVSDRLDRLGLAQAQDTLASLLRVEVHPMSLHLVLDRAKALGAYDEASPGLERLNGKLDEGERLVVDRQNAERLRIILPIRLKPRGGRVWITNAAGKSATTRAPDKSLIRALRTGHQVARDCGCHPASDAAALASSVGPKDSYDRKLAELSFLAPDIQLAILEGRQPEDLSVEKLLDPDLPLAWTQQRRVLGFV